YNISLLNATHPARLAICSELLLFPFNDPPTTQTYTLSLHDALPIFGKHFDQAAPVGPITPASKRGHPKKGKLWLKVNGELRQDRSEEHTSELQSLRHLVCRLLLEKKKKNIHNPQIYN